MSEPPAQAPQPRVAVTVLGAMLVLAATGLVAIVESFLVPLRVGPIRAPVSVAIAVVVHPLLVLAMRALTRSTLAMLAPFALWLVLIAPLVLRRAEGDVIIAGNNWVATALLFGGALVFVGSVGVLIPSRRATAGSLGGNGSS